MATLVTILRASGFPLLPFRSQPSCSHIPADPSVALKSGRHHQTLSPLCPPPLRHRSSIPRSSFPSSPALVSAVDDLFEFICTGPLLQRMGFSTEKVAEGIDKWLICGGYLCRLFKMDELRLNVADKTRIYHFYVPVFLWCEEQVQRHASAHGDAEEVPPPLVIGIRARPLRSLILGFAGACRFFPNPLLAHRLLFSDRQPSGDPSCFPSNLSPARRLLFGVRQLSASVQSLAREKDFERIYVDDAPSDSSIVHVATASLDECGDAAASTASEAVINRDLTETEKEAWSLLKRAVVNYCGRSVGTVAASDPTETALNYDQVFIRDFVPSAIAFLLKGDSEIVRNFLLHTLQLQSWEKTVDCYSPGQGLMPASFKVRTVPLDGSNEAFEEVLDPDFGESAIGRVAPVDSGLWWIILLRAYGKITGDYSLQERVDVQLGIKLVLNLCLTDGFDMFPSLLVTDGSCMIDRRMGIHGHPLEIQALYYSALRCAREMIAINDGSNNLVHAINNRLSALSFHIREYYWVDMKKINEIYRYKTEEYSHDAINKFNIYPDQIPSWLVDWIPDRGGYLIGNLQPAHMDFRLFSLGNLWAIVSSLATPKQAEGILNLFEDKWDDLVANMPLKICYPALEYEEWRIITGSDPKNTPWSYHNGGSWPTLLWQFTLACIKIGRPGLAERAVTVAEKRISNDKWPEYYDTRSGRFIGKQARLYQTWTIAGYLTSKMLLDNPEMATILTCDEDLELLEFCICGRRRSSRTKCSRLAARSQVLV